MFGKTSLVSYQVLQFYFKKKNCALQMFIVIEKCVNNSYPKSIITVNNSVICSFVRSMTD